MGSPTQLTATFGGGTVPVGTYSVEVVNPGGTSDLLANAFEMIAGVGAKLTTNLMAPAPSAITALPPSGSSTPTPATQPCPPPCW